MASMYGDCHSCGKSCIETAFCNEGGSLDNAETGGISVPRNLKIKIIANPVFWGFSGTLIEGWARYETGYFDYFDGLQLDHKASKTCGATTVGPFKNEQRPDVFYRSVYDPDTGSVHYGEDGTEDGIERGGAEVYLVDRIKGLVEAVSADNPSCDTTSPTQVFKKFPENYGFGNKIAYKESVYKNSTGAWRLIDLQSCNDIVADSQFYAKECDGTSKEHIARDDNYLTEYDQYSYRANLESGCVQDGGIPRIYSGYFETTNSIIRDTGASYFSSININYNGSAASGLKNGMQIFIDNNVSEDYNSGYYIADVQHGVSSTSAKLVGTWGDTNFSINIGSSGRWSVANTFDPNTCCGGAAYGIDNESKRPFNDINYHSDLGKIFNNNKNKVQSNRFPENRNTYDLPVVTPTGNSPRTDHSYTTLTSSGTAELSSGYPVFEKELAYYGPFHETDRFDGDVRHDHKYNTITGRNFTCYSKHASLDIFPDCLTQYKQYQECTTLTEKYETQRVSRLAFVYRGCDFNDPCTFDSEGRPLAGWSTGAPTGINDLKRGLAGQELYMYLNLSSAWGGEIDRCPCDCSMDPPLGEQPPEMISVDSPVTFPCVINFDLRPEEYGCNDARYQISKYKQFVSTTFAHETCDTLPSLPETCNVRQPYTTYGFMRNLCGKVDKNRKDVITEAFSRLVQSGVYRNTTPAVSINEPMYWEFQNPGPTPPVFNSGDWNGTATNGFYNSGQYPYWGLADSNGNLVSPYFQATSGDFACCSGTPGNYVDFDASATFFSGWPTDLVPFLIEIDHTDICAGCSTIVMDTGNLMLTLSSLDTKFSHNHGNTASQGGKYGYNNCQYGGTALDPTYSCPSGYSNDYCASGDNYYPEFGTPYVGETCACISGTEISLRPKMIGSSKLPLGWISNVSGQNSFVNLSGCKNPNSDYLNIDYLSGAAGGYSVYASFRLACPENLSFLNEPRFPFAFYEGDAVSNLWGCNDGSCAHTYPAAGNQLQLNGRFFLISDARRSDFEALSEDDLTGPLAADILQDGIIIGTPINGGSRNIQLCSGEKVLAYGCAIGAGFYPCESCTPVTTCASCSGLGVVCDSCENVTSVNGYPTRRVPANYELNECKCECATPSLVRVYSVDGSGNLSLDSTLEPYGCTADIYWAAISGVDRGLTDPFLLNQTAPFPHMGVGPFEITADDYCSFKTGVNAIASGISYRFTEPYADSCNQMWPQTCDSGTCVDSRARSAVCGDPIPFFTGTVTANQKTCFPEVMMVNKVTCVGSGFLLNVSREYHTHDRTWYTMVGAECVPKQTGAYTYGGCNNLPWAVPADSVTPAYSGNCSSHSSSGTYANQDFLYTNKPVSSGDTLWNYYNIFAPSGANYIPATDGFCGVVTATVSGYLFSSGETNKRHSCVQDIPSCGSDFFCNKMFFPRKSYHTNTKVVPFGALQICTQNARLQNPNYYTGYQDFDTTDDLLTEATFGRFVDPCNTNSYAVTLSETDIDSTEIFVDDYLPLIGIVHPTWKNTSNIKSCLIPTTGECDGVTMPYTHNDSTISSIYRGPVTWTDNSFNSMGYYYPTIASGADECIFSRFKIMVDVECCTDRIKRIDNQLDDPTLLNFVFTDVPAGVCKGMVSPPACSCASSTCDNLLLNPGSCTPVFVVTYLYNELNCSGTIYAQFPPTSLSKYVIDYNNGLAASAVTQYKSTCGGSPTNVTLYTHPCYPGQHFEKSGPYYVRTWECGTSVYANLIGGGYSQSNCCNINTSLCGAIASGHKFLTTDTCIFASDTINGESITNPNDNWRTECGCTFVDGGDTVCSDTSIIKVTITEDI